MIIKFKKKVVKITKFLNQEFRKNVKDKYIYEKNVYNILNSF